jgi:hypothetical protein
MVPGCFECVVDGQTKIIVPSSQIELWLRLVLLHLDSVAYATEGVTWEIEFKKTKKEPEGSGG